MLITELKGECEASVTISKLLSCDCDNETIQNVKPTLTNNDWLIISHDYNYQGYRLNELIIPYLFAYFFNFILLLFRKMNNKVINYFRQHTLATVKTNRLKSKKKKLKVTK